MQTLKYKQRALRLRNKTKEFEIVEAQQAKTPNRVTFESTSTKLNGNVAIDNITVEKYKLDIQELERKLTIEKQQHTTTKTNLLLQTDQVKSTKVALRDATEKIRALERELIKEKSIKKESCIPRPISAGKSRDNAMEKTSELCKHLLESLEDNSSSVRRELIEKVNQKFPEQVLKTTLDFPTLNEYLSQKDVSLVTFKMRSYLVIGLLSGNLRIQTAFTTRFDMVKLYFKQIAIEWHIHNDISYIITKLKPQLLIVLKNGDLKLIFDAKSLYIYSNGTLYYLNDQTHTYLYPYCEMRIINGQSNCIYFT